ncbi:mitotic spindle checkpoint protein MAD1 isoform X1 [Eucalyptus grandis]|uniref:mitotic spindle checkpoint protein MAD1 isoform X1 n=1 Tax=Eucalyptus grandis TaxID=71139 RepID=UPI00192EBA24|nr:mitotic spindle checkpoint protein MAD1 isoform X1 [Eucalyptus grandis]
MILRTPPPSKKQRLESRAAEASPAVGSDRQVVIYEDPPDGDPNADQPSSSSDHLLCTYQCRQMVKSEFFEALSSAEKQARDYHSQLQALNDDFLKADAERKKFREQLLYAEQELAAARGREQALQGQLFKEVRDSQERLKKQIQSHSEMEIKLQNEMNLRKSTESLAASAEEKASLSEGKLSRLSGDTQSKNKSLRNELVQLQRESKLSISRISADLEKMECRAVNAEKQSNLLKEQLEELRKQFNECLHQKSEAEKKLSTLTFQESSSNETTVLVKHLQEELRNYESEVREARKLKSSHEQVELIKEKLLEERGRRERAELETSQLQELLHDMKKVEEELRSWKLTTKDIPGVSCPDDIPLKFAALQKEVIESTMKVGEANARLKQMEVALDEATLSKQRVETEAALAKQKAEESISEIKRIQSTLSVITEERDKYQTLVNELKKPEKDETGSKVANELQLSLAKKECCIKEMESSLNEQKEAYNRQREEIKLLNERLNNEARRIKSLERESDRLRSEISLLESKLGHGDFSAASTKVLRMVNTLAVDNEAKQTIQALQTELQKTKDRLQAVEELNNQSGNAAKSVDCQISEKITQLKEQIATLEKREERYKTVFADRISVFRRACCELFGYKIVMDEHQRPNGIPVTRFTLLSIYAQNDEEKLEFEYESGNVTILGNDYSSHPEISRQIGIFIHKMNSIPAFTANITVESFNRRTLS